MIYQIEDDYYSEAFPWEEEYVDWINRMENDIATGKLIVDDRTNIVLHKDNTEEYSPYATVNS
jgi:hypothetical protein